jgi:peptidoglycan/xylan/chitin deacetylase (PgdA/CDA1 family)
MDRRNFIKGGTALGLGIAPAQAQQSATRTAFWPGGARFVVSLSLQLETGAQPERGANGPWGNLDTRYEDMPTEKWYEYGFKEGVPRLLDLFERRKVSVTSHMVGLAVEKHPALAKEIVQRGHEAAAHAQTWAAIYDKPREEEKAAIEAGARTVERVTGVRPLGFNAPGMRGTPNTLEILQELGFLYHTDDLSRDEPFVVQVRSKPFMVVPYTFQLNDYQNYENRWRTCTDFAGELKAEFDALYLESQNKRRMMSIATHDRVARPSRVRVLDEFISYAQSHPGVVFLKKEEIARFALSSPLTIHEA